MVKEKKEAPLLPPLGDKTFQPMGQGSFANMPEKSMMDIFPTLKGYRGGICNDPLKGVRKISNIDENVQQGLKYGSDKKKR